MQNTHLDYKLNRKSLRHKLNLPPNKLEKSPLKSKNMNSEENWVWDSYP